MHPNAELLTKLYTFRETGNKVHNNITSKFEFRDGRITNQVDECDPVSFAKQAFGGLKGFLTGHIGFLRRYGAMKKLEKFIAQSEQQRVPPS